MGEIYAILKYLALIQPQRVVGTEGPRSETSYKVVVTPSPRRFNEAGWLGARIIDPEALPLAAAAPAVPIPEGAL